MKLIEFFRDYPSGNTSEQLTKKRFACANCGVTWIEFVGLIVMQRNNKEDLCLQLGMESEACQMCKMRPRKCKDCGSSDVYELNFVSELNDVPLTYKTIKIIQKSDKIKH